MSGTCPDASGLVPKDQHYNNLTVSGRLVACNIVAKFAEIADLNVGVGQFESLFAQDAVITNLTVENISIINPPISGPFV